MRSPGVNATVKFLNTVSPLRIATHSSPRHAPALIATTISNSYLTTQIQIVRSTFLCLQSENTRSDKKMGWKIFYISNSYPSIWSNVFNSRISWDKKSQIWTSCNLWVGIQSRNSKVKLTVPISIMNFEQHPLNCKEVPMKLMKFSKSVYR